MSEIIQNISDIFFLTSGNVFPPYRREVQRPDKMSCSEKSNIDFRNKPAVRLLKESSPQQDVPIHPAQSKELRAEQPNR